MVPWVIPSPQSKQDLIRLSSFCRAHYCDRLADHATRSLTVGRIYVRSMAMQPNNGNITHILWIGINVRHVQSQGGQVGVASSCMNSQVGGILDQLLQKLVVLLTWCYQVQLCSVCSGTLSLYSSVCRIVQFLQQQLVTCCSQWTTHAMVITRLHQCSMDHSQPKSVPFSSAQTWRLCSTDSDYNG